MRIRKTSLPVYLLLIFFILISDSALAGDSIILAKVSATINPTIKDYIKSAIKKAEKENAEALIIELDTPGGLRIAAVPDPLGRPGPGRGNFPKPTHRVQGKAV